MKTYELKSGYSGQEKVPAKKFRDITFQEVLELKYRNSVYFIDRYGKYREARVNCNSPKLWKTRPLDANVPLKYGLKECFTAEWRDGEQVSLDRIIVPLEEEA